MIKLSVNLNKIALIRNSRAGNYPDIVDHARICIAAGADGITVHPRPDQRHIRPDDVRALAECIATTPGIEFNVEGNPFAEADGDYPGLLALVRATRPHQCTLVPDARGQLTSDHGFDLSRSADRLQPLIGELQALGTRVSLFLDPDLMQIDRARALNADRIELYTGPFAAAWDDAEARDGLFQTYYTATRYATALGLGVNAGHDLNRHNLTRFARIPGLLEVSIGHALIVDALALGLANAVRAYRAVLGVAEP